MQLVTCLNKYFLLWTRSVVCSRIIASSSAKTKWIFLKRFIPVLVFASEFAHVFPEICTDFLYQNNEIYDDLTKTAGTLWLGVVQELNLWGSIGEATVVENSGFIRADFMMIVWLFVYVTWVHCTQYRFNICLHPLRATLFLYENNLL